jgi:hypothetical protein
MAKISPELEQQFINNPAETVNLIVRTTGGPSPRLAWLDAAGLKVTQQFRLTPGVAVTCTGQNALKLLTQDWVLSVELDAPVHTMGL